MAYVVVCCTGQVLGTYASLGDAQVAAAGEQAADVATDPASLRAETSDDGLIYYSVRRTVIAKNVGGAIFENSNDSINRSWTITQLS